MSDRLGYVDKAFLERLGGRLNGIKLQTYELMQVKPGQQVLDVGCGPGIDTVALAQIVGEQGFVTGIDFDPQMIADADERARIHGVAGRVRHVEGDITDMPLEDNTFDACRSERVFHHIPEPAKAVAEMARVTKPGGWIVINDVDFGSASVDFEDVELERRMSGILTSKRYVNNPLSGRTLYRLFRQQGLVDITFASTVSFFTELDEFRFASEMDRVEQIALAQHIATEAEISRWRDGLAQAAAAGVLYVHAILVTIAGRKPA